MSAPTPAAGDAYPGEGYYPDPSIPGYLRYWSGTGWVAGTSRPAPADGSVPPPPPGYPRQAAQPQPAPGAGPVAPEETGPLFFDGPRTATSPVLYGPESTAPPQDPGPWGANTPQGQAPRVSWGTGPEQGGDPRVPHPAASPEAAVEPNPYGDVPQPPYDTRPPLEPVRPQPVQPRPEGTGTVSLRPQGSVTPYQGAYQGQQGQAHGQGAGADGAGPDAGGRTGSGERPALGAADAYPALPAGGGPTTGGQGTLSMRPRRDGRAAGEWVREQGWAGGPAASPEPAPEPGASARAGVAFGKPAGMDDTVRARAARLAEQDPPLGAQPHGAQPLAAHPQAAEQPQAVPPLAEQPQAARPSAAHPQAASGPAVPGGHAPGTPGNLAAASRVGPTGGPSEPLGEPFDHPLGAAPGAPSAHATPGSHPHATGNPARATGNPAPTTGSPAPATGNPAPATGSPAPTPGTPAPTPGTHTPGNPTPGNPAPAPHVGPVGGPAQPLGEAFDHPPRATPASPPGPAPSPASPPAPARSWAAQVSALAQPAHAAPGTGAGGPDVPVTPFRPVREDPFTAAARRQAAARPAGLGRRLLARIVDSLLLGALTGAAVVPLASRAADHVQAKIDAAKLSGETVEVWLIDTTTVSCLLASVGVLLVLGLLYEALPTARFGRTLGKKLLGLHVRDIEEHEPPGFAAALRRWLVYAVPGLLGIGVVGVVWACFDRPWRQCWHDKAAHTFVAR
ncbi:RDD family protein [Streptomyces sp. NRRL F-5630]|uniref:RDD family protein n=1 Tax=Streptomyces sp. NRRL F-5630 TaxID=1463864 RepID=UPI003EBDA4AF